MNIQVKRIAQGDNSTLSEISMDGEFICYGLEDSVRDVKIKGSTAIPAGNYRLALNTYGAMNARYKRKFPALHRGMIEIMDIPNFKYVYIHIGNTFADTAGCLLVGQGHTLVDGDYILTRSAKAYKKLYALIIQKMEKEEVFVQIKDQPSPRI